MKDYVYRNLKRYGNTIISEKTYDKLGKEKILNDLKKHGFNCEIRVIINNLKTFGEQLNDKPIIDKVIIIEEVI